MENNTAIVAVLRNIRPIPEADKIVQADVVLDGIKLTQVVVGKETVDGITVVYFDSNLCLSEELLKDYPDLGTYLGKGNRVKAVKLKGIISNGLVVEVEKFYRYTMDGLKEGFSFNDLGSVPICKKWIPSAQRNSGGANTGRKLGQNRLIADQFYFHKDTDNLLKNIRQVHPDSIISITRKVHGTSAIVGNLLVKEPDVPWPTSWKTKLGDWLGIPRILFISGAPDYDYLYASRNTVKNGVLLDEANMDPREVEARKQSFENDLWVKVGKEHFGGKLKKGETVYFEIIGYRPGGGFIQKNYDYGCKPGEHKALVYRITKTGPDGHVVEYGWQAMKERCQELGVESVQEFYFGRARDLFPIVTSSPEVHGVEDWRKDFLEAMKKEYLEKDAWDCAKKGLPDEGVVIRVEGLEIQAYKLKSERFVLGSSEAQEKGEIDLEDLESASGLSS